MQDVFAGRFDELSQRGAKLIAGLPRDENGPSYWAPEEYVPEYQAWLSSVTNLIHSIVPSGNPFIEQCYKIINHEDLKTGISARIFLRMYGLLLSVKDEWEHGLLRKIEYIVAGATFDDFLDHAAVYHKANKKTEAAVLASAVLEDAIKKIATKHNITTSGLSVEPLIEELVKMGVLTLVKSKRIKGYTGVRNHALHAEWDKFDIRDVGELIKGTKELIEEFL